MMLHYWHSFKQKYCKRRSAHAAVAIKNWADEEKKRWEEKRRAAAAASPRISQETARSQKLIFQVRLFSRARGCFNSLPAKDKSGIVVPYRLRTLLASRQRKAHTKKSEQTLRIGHACTTAQRKHWEKMCSENTNGFFAVGQIVTRNPTQKS